MTGSAPVRTLDAADRRLVARSLELIATRCPDPTPLVYGRLFDRHPEMQPLFIRDSTGAVRGEMLAKVFEIILDLVEAGRYAANMVRCEVVTHEGYGVPPQVFPVFFEIVADVMRDLLEGDWTPSMASGWAALVDELRTLTLRNA
jgi:hemoglobin-like flavoprotein